MMKKSRWVGIHGYRHEIVFESDLDGSFRISFGKSSLDWVSGMLILELDDFAYFGKPFMIELGLKFFDLFCDSFQHFYDSGNCLYLDFVFEDFLRSEKIRHKENFML